ncbi:hypothetical protein GCM10022224_000080 [Nonomuraea antimicrobica]|uniref:Uncharacterized protein n=1 Tax=Nonomuraea antimicrobica TaxID=561173 RepID=A0ABP7AWH8_9ACTN
MPSLDRTEARAMLRPVFLGGMVGDFWDSHGFAGARGFAGVRRGREPWRGSA